jgi:DNA repair exonuclease SbcCD ATPase subunit
MTFGGLGVDAAVAGEGLRVVQPGALDAAVRASGEAAEAYDDVLETLQRDVEATRSTAQRAGKQYDAADPENRLVVDELERRWTRALEHVQELEHRLEEHRKQQPQRPAATLEDVQALAADLETLWHAPEADLRLKKRIVRTLMQEVVVEVETQAGAILLLIPWQGGVHTA